VESGNSITYDIYSDEFKDYGKYESTIREETKERAKEKVKVWQDYYHTEIIFAFRF